MFIFLLIREAREDLKNVRGEDMSYPVLGFHGTDVTNISLICQNGFKVPGETLMWIQWTFLSSLCNVYFYFPFVLVMALMVAYLRLD